MINIPFLHQLTQLLQSAWTKPSNRFKLRRAIASGFKTNKLYGIVFQNGCYSHLHTKPFRNLASEPQVVKSSKASDRQIHIAIDELQLPQFRVESEGQGIHTAIVSQSGVAEQYREMLRNGLIAQGYCGDRPNLVERSSFEEWLDFIEDNEASSIPQVCNGCRNYYGKAHGGDRLVCAKHPYGVEGQCEDWESCESD
jgi:hypothetical protein